LGLGRSKRRPWRKTKCKPIFLCALKKTIVGSVSTVDAGHRVPSFPVAVGVVRRLRLVLIILLLPRQLMVGLGLSWALINVRRRRCLVLIRLCLSVTPLFLSSRWLGSSPGSSLASSADTPVLVCQGGTRVESSLIVSLVHAVSGGTVGFCGGSPPELTVDETQVSSFTATVSMDFFKPSFSLVGCFSPSSVSVRSAEPNGCLSPNPHPSISDSVLVVDSDPVYTASISKFNEATTSSAASTLVRPFGGIRLCLLNVRVFTPVFTWDVLEGSAVQVG